MSTADDTVVYLRRIPDGYDSNKYTVSGNNVYEKGKPHIRTTLESCGEVRQEDLARLCGGEARFELLNAAGSVASIMNLGVSVLGFMHVSRLLKRVEDRLDGVETKLDDLSALVGVIDHKVDQLIELSEAQTDALADVHRLIVSSEVAKVHTALETLDILSGTPKTPERDLRIRAAADALQLFRNWLADRRESTNPSKATIPARTEFLRAEVAVTLAECRARCLAGDAAFAARVLDRAIAEGREEMERMYDQVETHHLVSHPMYEDEWGGVDTVEAAEAVAWLKGISSTEAAIELATDTKDFAIRAVENLQWTHGRLLDFAGRVSFDQLKDRMNAVPELADLLSGDEDEEAKGLSDEEHDLKAEFRAYLELDGAPAAAAAGFVASCRLVGDLEAALAMCAALELFGERIYDLFADGRPASTPALILDWSGV